VPQTPATAAIVPKFGKKGETPGPAFRFTLAAERGARTKNIKASNPSGGRVHRYPLARRARFAQIADKSAALENAAGGAALGLAFP
jgi:hypothetical protein